MAYSPNLAPSRFPQYGVLYLLPNNSNISSSFANAGLTQFLPWEIFFLSAVTDFLGRPSPTRVVQSDTFIGILTTNVKYSKFTKIYIANWVNNIVYFFAKFHWTFLTVNNISWLYWLLFDKGKGKKAMGWVWFYRCEGANTPVLEMNFLSTFVWDFSIKVATSGLPVRGTHPLKDRFCGCFFWNFSKQSAERIPI